MGAICGRLQQAEVHPEFKAEWIVREEPRLRIITDELWKRVKYTTTTTEARRG